MNDPKDIFIAARKELTLTREERARMRSNLEDAMNRVPMVMVSVPSPIAFWFQPARALAFVVALVVVSSSGAAWAAEGALPGDKLYSVKLGVNERLEKAFAVGEVAKAGVEVRHAEERLQEVELLAAKGPVSEEVIDTAVEKVEAHVEEVGRVAKALALEGDETTADAMHTRISSALAAHAEIIRAQSQDADDERPLRVLALKVDNAVENAEDAQDEDIERPSEDDAWAQRLSIAREASARERLDTFAKKLAEARFNEKTWATLDTERAEMEREYMQAAELSMQEEYRESANAYEKLERRAYRSLVLLASAARIEESSDDKEVLITVERVEEEVATHDTAANEAAATTMLMKAASVFEAVPEIRVREEFRFRVRDREEE